MGAAQQAVASLARNVLIDPSEAEDLNEECRRLTYGNETERGFQQQAAVLEFGLDL